MLWWGADILLDIKKYIRINVQFFLFFFKLFLFLIHELSSLFLEGNNF